MKLGPELWEQTLAFKGEHDEITVREVWLTSNEKRLEM